MFLSKTGEVFTVPVSKIKASKLKNFSKQNAEENLIRDLRPILVVARIFGIAPYTINNRNFTWSKNGLIYSGLFLILCCHVFIRRIELFLSQVVPIKVSIIYITMMVTSVMCILMDVFNCVFFDNKKQEFFNYIIQYDVSTKYENRIRNRFSTWSWIGLLGLVLIILTTEILAWKFENNSILAGTSILLFCSTLTFAIMKFIAFGIILYLRFKDLNQKVERDLTFAINTEEINKNNNHFREVWQHHDFLLSAAKTLKSMYSSVLLIWFSIIFLTCVLQIFGAFSKDCNFFVVLNNFMISFIFILLLLSLAAVCHLITSEANKIGGLITSPKYFQRFTASEKLDICLIGQYLQINTFYFTAFGLFNINLTVLLTVASTMTTYLIILMSPNEH